MEEKTITIAVKDMGDLLVEVFQRGARQGRREVDEMKVDMGKLILDIDQLRAVMQRVHDEAPFPEAQKTYWQSEMSAAINATRPREE